MSYRDETLVLRERLLVLEAERAKLAGTAQGIRFRTLEADEDKAQLRRTLALEKAKANARRASYRFVGILVGLALLLLTCLVSTFAFHKCTDVSNLWTTHHNTRGSEALGRCYIRIEDPFLSDCRAHAWCRSENGAPGGEVWEGKGTCGEGRQRVEFVSTDGPGTFTFVRGIGRAVYRPSEGESVILEMSTFDP